MNLSTGDRLCVDGHFCVVRYIGKVRQWGDLTAFGLEWDDASRGKHSGTVNGVKYFETEIDDAGSLLKEAKVVRASCARNSFVEALNTVYLSGRMDNTDVYIGSKRVEMLGLDVLSARNQDIRNLKIVNLSTRGISTSGTEQELSLCTGNLKSLKDLDLSYNLFTDFKEVLNIARGLKSLKTLNVSGNRFSAFNNEFDSEDFTIEELIADDCEFADASLKNLSSVFPKLKKLSINGARNTHRFRADGISSSIKEISMAHNGLKQFPTNVLSSGIEKLNISLNLISESPTIKCASLKVLDISFCQLSSWGIVDDLCIKLPNLESLKINGNPITEIEDEDAILQVIGRIRELKYLNGTFINEHKRTDAELYFLSLVAKKQAHIDEDTLQWRYLVKKHGKIKRPTNIVTSVPKIEVLVLQVVIEEHKVQEMKVLPCYSVRYMKNIISKKISLSIFEFELKFTSKNGGLTHEFNFEFSPISSFNLEDYDTIHVIRKEA